MRRGLLLVLLGPLLWATSAQAAPERHVSSMVNACARSEAFTVVNRARVPPSYLAKVERAVEDQSAQVRTYWHSPCATFVPAGGWPVYIAWSVEAKCDAAGCHGSSDATPEGTPSAWVSVGIPNGAPSWTATFSHEVMEALIDPLDRRTIDGDVLEICDPVSTLAYRLDGVWISDFTLPADWRFPLPLHAALDEMRVL